MPMPPQQLTLQVPSGPEPANAWRRASRLGTLVRLFIFPAAINSWFLLLYVSQKVFLAPGLLLAGWGDAIYRRDLLLSFGVTFVAFLVYLNQPYNSFRDIHFFGFLLFVWSMPPLNYAIRTDTRRLLIFLSYFTILNVLLGVYFLYFNVDLQEFRGLNRIETSDGYTTRLFFESASLAAVFLANGFRRKAVRILALILVVAFVVLIARSFVIMLLLGLNLSWPYLVRGSVPFKALVAVVVLAVGYLAYRYLAELRPDVYLSLYAKQYQLTVILSWQEGWLGWGWGAFIPQLATDIDQPYQIEMQLPMLLLQLGPLGLGAVMILTLMLFLSATESFALALGRFAIYYLIGFNNPWLLLPSWYLTCQLLFRAHAASSVDGSPALRAS